MKKLASEFEAVSRLYLQLGDELSGIMGADEPRDAGSLAESILQNRASLARIEQMNARVLQLSNRWKTSRSKLDPKSQTEIDALAERVRGQAIRLNELCGIHARKLQAARDKLAADLVEMGKGARYLKSVKPTKNNYPKFIDSLY